MVRSFHTRYTVLAAAFVIQGVVIGGMFAYGVFFKVLEEELGWSRTLLSGTSSLSFIVMGVLAMVAGRLNDRFGPRWVLSVSAVSYGLGYALMYYVDAPWKLLVFYGVFIGLGLSTHDVVTLSTVARWFEAKRGLATGVVKVGTACGQIVLPLAATALIAAFGWRAACAVLGLASGAILVAAAQGLREPVRVETLAPGGGTPAGSLRGTGLTLVEARRTRQMWTLCAAQFMFFPSVVTIPVHITAHGVDSGLGVASAAALLSVIGGVSIVGRLTVGSAVDWAGGRRAMLTCFALLFTSLVWLRFADTPWMLFAFAAVYGVAHGGFFTVVSPTVAEYFGTRAHGAIFGVVLFFGTIGGALGPLLAGRVFDVVGSYNAAFVTLAVMALAGMALVASLRPIRSSSLSRFEVTG